jgi:hypothetical protein
MIELWIDKWMNEIKWNGWPFTCGLITPQTYYIYGWQHVYVILNAWSPFSPYRRGRWCGCHKLILMSSTTTKEEYLWSIASYDHTSRFGTKTNNFLIFFSEMWPTLKDTSISPGQTLKRWVSSVGCSMVKQDDWPLKVRATHGTSDFYFFGEQVVVVECPRGAWGGRPNPINVVFVMIGRRRLIADKQNRQEWVRQLKVLVPCKLGFPVSTFHPH